MVTTNITYKEMCFKKQLPSVHPQTSIDQAGHTGGRRAIKYNE